MKKIILVTILLSFLNSYSQNFIVDESYLDDTFRVFKDELNYAVLTKDSVKLNSLIAENIDNGMEDNYVKSEFFKYHQNIAEKTDVWDKLNRVLKYGFHRGYRETLLSLNDKTKFTSPSYLKTINLEKENGKNRIAILAENLNVREKPNVESAIISVISYGLYEPLFHENHEIISKTSANNIEWVKIKLPNNMQGFIAKKYTSEYMFYTLVVSKIDGEWKITKFYGDIRNW